MGLMPRIDNCDAQQAVDLVQAETKQVLLPYPGKPVENNVIANIKVVFASVTQRLIAEGKLSEHFKVDTEVDPRDPTNVLMKPANFYSALIMAGVPVTYFAIGNKTEYLWQGLKYGWKTLEGELGGQLYEDHPNKIMATVTLSKGL